MNNLINKIFSHRDLRNRILVAILLLIAFRLIAHIPIPGVNYERLENFFDRNQAFGLLNLFTGGAMRNLSVAMMGVGPYITSSIIFQLLIMIVPQLEALSKEGEYGRQKINYYTRITTVPLAFMQSFAMIALLKNQGVLGSWTGLELSTILLSLTAGTILLMWLGELISEKGIGNGISLIITLGIVASLPTQVAQTIVGKDFANSGEIINLALFVALAVLITALIVWFSIAERQVPITYTRNIRGLRSLGGVDTHLPIRVTMAGVIPIIFALSMMIFPTIIAKFFQNARSIELVNFSKWIENILNDQTIYAIIYFVLVMLFTFFYTSVIFKPDQVAENLQKRGGFIPGLRPGRETSEYLGQISSRITILGAVFLAFVAVLPYIIPRITDVTTLALGGTGILIVVSVILDTYRQIKAQIIMRNYDNY